jgi:hypothetical protein
MLKQPVMTTRQPLPLLSKVVVAVALAVTFAPSFAFQVETGNNDLDIRLDNTFRFTHGIRAKDRDALMLDATKKTFNNDDGNANFNKGNRTISRLDIFSEFDLVYEKRHGMRLSYASWWDQVPDTYGKKGQKKSWSNHLDASGQAAYGVSDTTSKYHEGPDGELLDAFVFTSFDLGESQLNLRLGKHTTYWGESIFGFANSVSYSQMSIDAAKAYQSPGAEAKELFRPRNAISAQLAISPELSIDAQQFLAYESYRYPSPGSYLGFIDVLGVGAESYILTPGVNVKRTGDIHRDEKKDWGLAIKYSPEIINGSLGLYVRNYTDMQPAIILDARSVPDLLTSGGQAGFFGQLVSKGRFAHAYGGDVKLMGLSYGTNIGGVSIGIEAHQRKNTPLTSLTPCFGSTVGLSACNVLNATSSSVIPVGNVAPGPEGDIAARGTTNHFMINAIGVIANTPIFDIASYTVEFNYVSLDKVTRDPYHLYKGANRWYVHIDKPTKNAYGINVNFTPTWYNVFPSVDLSTPISVGKDIKGNSPLAGSYNEGKGSYSIGMNFTVQSRMTFELRYLGYWGEVAYARSDARTDPASDSAYSYQSNGVPAPLRDRNQLVFTFKTTF